MNKSCGCKVIYIPVGPTAQPIVNLWNLPLDALDFCPLHRAAPAMFEALTDIFAMIQNGELIRDIKKDGQSDWGLMMMSFVSKLQKAEQALLQRRPGMSEDAYRFRDWYIPQRMISAIDRYVNQGIQPGHFLTGVICNDLKEAISRADDENMVNLPAYLGYFCNEVPSACWGSEEKMKAWLESFRKE